MIRITKKLTLVTGLTAVVVGLGTGIAFAAAENDTDNINPANAKFTSTNSGSITFSGTLDGVSFTITCSMSSLPNELTPATGLGPVNLPNPPTFSGCTDNRGGTVAINIGGTWTLTFNDAADDEGIIIGTTTDEPPGHGTHSGDRLTLGIPKGGVVFTLNGCTLTTSGNSITGAYDDVNTVTFSGVTINVTASGCFASNLTMSGSYKVTAPVGAVIEDVS